MMRGCFALTSSKRSTQCVRVLLALALITESTTQALQPYKSCDYGALPGQWSRNAPMGQKWLPVLTRDSGEGRSVQEMCTRMEPLLRKMQRYERARYKSMTTPSALQDPRSQLIKRYQITPPTWQASVTNMYKRSHPSILFLGDHHDRWLALDACQAVRNMKNGVMQHMPRYPDLSQTSDANDRKHRLMYFSVCENGATSIAMRYVPGVHPTGPYFKQSYLEGLSSGNSSWAVRTEETLSLFSRYFRRDPDMIVLHANYRGEAFGDGSIQQLSEAVVHQWTDNMTSWVRHLARHVPHDTLLMLRTSPLPKADPRGASYLKQINSTQPFMQLNEAVRAVARRLGLPLLDSEMHLRNMPHRQVMRDNYNPSGWVNLEWMNMILNTLRQHKPRLFAHVSDVTKLEMTKAEEEARDAALPGPGGQHA